MATRQTQRQLQTSNGRASSRDTVADLEQIVPPVNRTREEEEEYTYRDGRGRKRTRTETRADELRRKGAFYRGEHVEVVTATTTGVDEDGTISGEAQIRETPYEDPILVDYTELRMPSDADLHALNRNEFTRVPDYLEQEIETRQEIIDECPVDVYCSSANRFWGWPHRLFSYYEASSLVAESGETIMVDSGHNQWGSPTDVLEAAAKVDADWVFATDVTGMEDPDRRYHNDAMPTVDDVSEEIREAVANHPDAAVTVESVGPALEGVRRFMVEARRLGICNRTILPIQSPYWSFLSLVDELGWLDEVRAVAIGGLLKIDAVEERIDALRDVRAYVGAEMDVHALAPGREPEMMVALRENADLVDSLDNSTPERAPSKDKIADATGSQHRHLFPRMEKGVNNGHVSGLRGAAALTIALETAFLLTDNCDVERTFPELCGEDDEQEDTDDSQQTDEQETVTDDKQQQISEWAQSG